jgi:hypothetical protein
MGVGRPPIDRPKRVRRASHADDVVVDNALATAQIEWWPRPPESPEQFGLLTADVAAATAEDTSLYRSAGPRVYVGIDFGRWSSELGAAYAWS